MEARRNLGDRGVDPLLQMKRDPADRSAQPLARNCDSRGEVAGREFARGRVSFDGDQIGVGRSVSGGRRVDHRVS